MLMSIKGPELDPWLGTFLPLPTKSCFFQLALVTYSTSGQLSRRSRQLGGSSLISERSYTSTVTITMPYNGTKKFSRRQVASFVGRRLDHSVCPGSSTASALA